MCAIGVVRIAPGRRRATSAAPARLSSRSGRSRTCWRTPRAAVRGRTARFVWCVGMADAPETSPIERPNTYELLAQRLLELIADGELAVGEPLPSERELVERFRVGRSSVREALRVLESKGLIDGGGKGRFVVSTSPKPLNSSLQVLLELKEADIEELYELREVIEGATVAFAAERRTDDDLTAIAATIDDMAAGLGSPDEYIDADLSFHLAIARAGNNRIAVHMMQ